MLETLTDFKTENKMIEIKFRGFRKDSNEWVKGLYLWNFNSFIRIYEDGFYDYEVDKKTVGQFTNMYDCNGREIFEGDILKSKNNEIFFISWRTPMFVLESFTGVTRGINYTMNNWEIIGNIYQNSNLLK